MADRETHAGGERRRSDAVGLLAALRADAPLPAGMLRSLLDGLLAEPVEGVWHPTGFVVLELLRDDVGALRLHLWPAGPRELGRPCWPVHDHVWDLRSQVLCGTVQSNGYEVHDDPHGDAVLYGVDYEPGRQSTMRRSERRVRARATPPRTIEAGQRYEVPAGEFHASGVGTQDFAATLVATRRTDRPRPWVVGAIDAADEIPVARPSASPGDVAVMLRRVVHGLAG